MTERVQTECKLFELWATKLGRERWDTGIFFGWKWGDDIGRAGEGNVYLLLGNSYKVIIRGIYALRSLLVILMVCSTGSESGMISIGSEM